MSHCHLSCRSVFLLGLVAFLAGSPLASRGGEEGPGDPSARTVREAAGLLASPKAGRRARGLARLEVLSRGRRACLSPHDRVLRDVLRRRAPAEAALAVRLLARSPTGWPAWLETLAAVTAPEVQLAAVDAAKETPIAARRALVDLARSESANRIRRALALEALGEVGGPAAVLLLTRPRAVPEDWLLASARALGLRRLGGEVALRALVRLLASEDAAPRVHAWESLERLTGARLPAEAAAWAAWLAAREKGGRKEAPGGEGDRYRAPRPLHIPTYYGIPIDRPRSHVVFCLDTSQSMWGRGIEKAREELRRTLLEFPTGYRFDVITFNQHVTPLFGRLVPAHPVVKAWTLAHLDALKTVSYTNLFDALETAFGYAGIGERAKERTVRLDAVFLLSDGAPNRGRVWRERPLIREIARLSRRRIPVHAVAAGEEVFPLLRKIAEVTGGRFADAFDFE